MAAQAGLAALMCAVSVAELMRREWILLLSVALGGLKAFQMPAQQALTANLVQAALLPRALAFSAGGMQVAIIAGPALGGFLYVAGAAATYGSCALLFLAAAALCATIRYHHAPARRDTTIATVLAGLRFVASHRVVLGAISLDLFAVLLGGATALLPIFAKDILDVGPAGLGVLRGAPAVGSLAMALLLTRWPIRRRTGPLLLGAVAVYGITMVVFGSSTSFALSLAALAVGGSADMVSVVIRQTLVQLETPDDMRGRVSAVNSLFIGASNQLGEFESGATAAWWGPEASVVVGGIGTCLVAAAWLRLFPALARRDSLVSGTAA
jgi:MFS family permease